MTDLKTTRVRAYAVGENAELHATRVRAYAVGENAEFRISRVRAYVIADPPGIDGDVSLHFAHNF